MPMTRYLIPVSFLMLGCGGDLGEVHAHDSGSTSASSTGTSATTGTPTGTASGTGCTSWLVTYDLTGSQLHIDALIDFDIFLSEPYTLDNHMGPGTITLRFADNGGEAGEGDITIVDYQMTQNFVTGNALATVTTELENTAEDACGLAVGNLAGTVASWTNAAIDPNCQTGQISCSGSFCGSGGSPASDSPVVIDNECAPLPISDFVFAADLSTFDMPVTTIASDASQATSLRYVGAVVETVQDVNTPSCYCE